MHGERFSALDVILGYCTSTLLERGFLEEEEEEDGDTDVYGPLRSYAEGMMRREAFRRARGEM